MIIRLETNRDTTAIREITETAFRDRPYAGGDEQDVIDRLREAGALVLSLVAVDGDAVVGQVTFSPALLSDGSGPWFALGPVAVLPSRQGEGTGAALIEEGLARIESLGALGCILTGNPAYYRRFGFENSPENAPPDEPAAFFMLKLLKGNAPKGTFSFHPAFYGDI